MRKITTAFCMFATIALHAQNIDFKVEGVADKNVENVYFAFDSDFEHIDSVAVSDGKFSISGNKKSNSIVTLALKSGKMISFINDGTSVNVDLSSMNMQASDNNLKFFAYQKEMHSYAERIESLYKSYKEETMIAKQKMEKLPNEKMQLIAKNMEVLEKQQVDFVVKVAKENKQQIFPALFINEVCYSMKYTVLDEVLDTNAKYYSSEILNKAKKIQKSYEKRKPGMMFHDIEMADMNGKMQKLSNYCGKGKYVLVDFWASWCGPCRQEMPNVVKSYEMFKDTNKYEIIGISFDQKEMDWKNAVKNLGMEWIQLSDLKGWKCEAAPLYGINSIPSNVLLDPNGNIIEVDLRGDELINTLEEILKK